MSNTQSSTLLKREKPYTRKMKPMTRSGSLLGTIKDIVSAPLSWFASNQEHFEDLGKRRRVIARDLEDIEEQQDERTGKRMRVDSPERSPERVQPSGTGGYLDPPPFSSLASRLIARRGANKKARSDKRASSLGPSVRSNRQALSSEPQSRYATFGHDSAPVGLNPDAGLERLRVQSGPRTSAIPQLGTGSLRRESSAPPLPNLQSRPTFVKPPVTEKQTQDLRVQKVVPLGTLADLSRGSRALTRDRTLTTIGQTSSVSDQIVPLGSPDAISQPSKSLPAKIFHELEMYKTPILPSRYKDTSDIPAFLKPKRSHVPIPMSKKGRGSKPSLGMPEVRKNEKAPTSSRDDGKPYARSGGIQTLIARRKAEEEEERQRKVADTTQTSIEEDDGMETDAEPPVTKRDIGVSAHLPSGSEDERMRSHRTPVVTIETPPVLSSAVPSSAASDPFSHPPATTPGGRSQPYGRVGRTRTREPGHRSVPITRPARNKYSAKGNDDECAIMEDQSMLDGTLIEQPQAAAEAKRTPIYEAPKGFSFPSNTSIINLDVSKAKEPPIQSLPFSIENKPADTLTSASKPKESIAFKPVPVVSVDPPTSVRSAKEVQETSAPSSLFAVPSTSSGAGGATTSSSAPKPAGVPNFFANSPLLAGSKATNPVAKAPASLSTSVPGTTPTTPVKDPENPLWDGNRVAQGAPPKLFAGATKPSIFGTGEKSGEAASAASAPTIFNPSSGGQLKPATADSTGQPHLVQPASPKPSEPEKKTNGSGQSPLFTFNGSVASNVPKPLFGTGSVATSAFPIPPSQSGHNVAKEPAPKQGFTFGNKPSVAQSSQPPQSVPASAEQKSPFTFGATPMLTGASNASMPTTNDAVSAPKPLFGGPAGGTSYTFGAPSAPAAQDTGTDKPSSPFAFGAPPATPPAGGERQNSPFTFGAPGPSPATATGFPFGTPIKENGSTAESNPSTPTNTSPFVFGGQAQSQPVRPVTPPSKPDDGMCMEESPIQMDTNGGQKKSAGSITFGAGPTPVNPFGQITSSGPAFTFGAPLTSNPFAQKDKQSETVGFNFNRTASAPTISTSFSFDAKSDQSAPPATAFGTSSNPFTSTQTSGTTTTPFTFGQQQAAPLANPFGAPTQPTQTSGAPGAAPSSTFSNATSFNFGAPSGASSNPFVFGSSNPSSPAAGASGLPQTSGPSGNTTPFTFGQPSGNGTPTGGALFNIGAPPPANPGTPGRTIRKLPRRPPAPR